MNNNEKIKKIRKRENEQGKKENYRWQLENEHDSKPGSEISRRIKTISKER